MCFAKCSTGMFQPWRQKTPNAAIAQLLSWLGHCILAYRQKDDWPLSSSPHHYCRTSNKAMSPSFRLTRIPDSQSVASLEKRIILQCMVQCKLVMLPKNGVLRSSLLPGIKPSRFLYLDTFHYTGISSVVEDCGTILVHVMADSRVNSFKSSRTFLWLTIGYVYNGGIQLHLRTGAVLDMVVAVWKTQNNLSTRDKSQAIGRVFILSDLWKWLHHHGIQCVYLLIWLCGWQWRMLIRAHEWNGSQCRLYIGVHLLPSVCIRDTSPHSTFFTPLIYIHWYLNPNAIALKMGNIDLWKYNRHQQGEKNSQFNTASPAVQLSNWGGQYWEGV